MHSVRPSWRLPKSTRAKGVKRLPLDRPTTELRFDTVCRSTSNIGERTSCRGELRLTINIQAAGMPRNVAGPAKEHEAEIAYNHAIETISRDYVPCKGGLCVV